MVERITGIRNLDQEPVDMHFESKTPGHISDNQIRTVEAHLVNDIQQVLNSSQEQQQPDDQQNQTFEPLSPDLRPLFRDSLDQSMKEPGYQIENEQDDMFHVIPGADEMEPYLLLIVHGIGSNTDTQSLNKENFDSCIANLLTKGYQTETQFQFMTHVIDWKSIVDSSEQRQKMNGARINNEVEAAREMFNLTAPDVLQYLSPSYQQTIWKTVVHKANLAYQSMFQRNSRYKGRVSIVAHSLGTVISYDLLCMQDKSELSLDFTFKFEVENFFMLGSPVGMFVSVYQPLENKIAQNLPKCRQFYNIYHPCDLIASRVEPLMEIFEQETLAPVLIPCYWNSGLNKASKMLKYMGDTLMQFVIRSDKIENNTELSGEQRQFQRRDYMVQERGFESFVKTLGLLHSHNSYFSNKDVANFILLKIHNKTIDFAQ